MASVHLVCEGKDLLDYQVLTRILSPRVPDLVIEPVGGDASVRSVRAWLSSKDRSHRVFSIEDRNWRPVDQVEIRWTTDSHRLIWHRHEIENYLLDPRVVAAAFASFRDTSPKWPSAIPSDIEAVSQLLVQLATPMVEDYAGHLTYYRLQTLRTDDLELRTEWLGPRAKAWGRDAWLSYLRDECRRSKDHCIRFSACEQFDDAAVELLYDQHLAAAQTPAFLQSGQYLRDLGGHELMTALRHHILSYGIKLSLEDLENELLKSLEVLYAPGFFAPDDLGELIRRLS